MKTDGAIYHYFGKVITCSVKDDGKARVSRRYAVTVRAYQQMKVALKIERNSFGQDVQ